MVYAQHERDHGTTSTAESVRTREDYEVVSPLVALPSSRLVMPAGCHIFSCRPLIASPSCHLVVPAGCCIASRHPLVAPPSCRQLAVASILLVPCCTALLSSRCAGWLLCCLSMRRPFCLVVLVVPPSPHLVVSSYPPLVVSSCQLVVASSLIILSLCRPLFHRLDRGFPHTPRLAGQLS